MEKFGFVGLPNAGKSSLYNALAGGGALAAPYAFATKDPNVGVAKVPDHRLEQLAAMSKSKSVIPASVQFVDIGGLVEGASTGEGLGNKFLANIRESDAIVFVLEPSTMTMSRAHPIHSNTFESSRLNLRSLILKPLRTRSRNVAKQRNRIDSSLMRSRHWARHLKSFRKERRFIEVRSIQSRVNSSRAISS